MLCSFLFATSREVAVCGGELGICKERSDGIVSKANVTVAQCPNSEQSSNEQIGVNKKKEHNYVVFLFVCDFSRSCSMWRRVRDL